MKTLLSIVAFVCAFNANAIRIVDNNFVDSQWDESEITGYHFHTYWFQNDNNSRQKAEDFRNKIADEIQKGVLTHCRLNHMNTAPRGPHPIGSWETCCNSTGLSHAMSWFMQNRGSHSVLLHPLTRYEIDDHTERAMFLGPSLFLDLSVLQKDLGEPDRCLPIDLSMDN